MKVIQVVVEDETLTQLKKVMANDKKYEWKVSTYVRRLIIEHLEKVGKK